MKKAFYLIFAISSAMNTFAQISPCPTKNQRRYSCGNVQENTLNRLVDTTYKMKSRFIVSLGNSFENSEDNNRAANIITLCNQVLNDRLFWNALVHYDRYRYAVFEDKDGKHQITGEQIVNCLINGSPQDNGRPEV